MREKGIRKFVPRGAIKKSYWYKLYFHSNKCSWWVGSVNAVGNVKISGAQYEFHITMPVSIWQSTVQLNHPPVLQHTKQGMKRSELHLSVTDTAFILFLKSRIAANLAEDTFEWLLPSPQYCHILNSFLRKPSSRSQNSGRTIWFWFLKLLNGSLPSKRFSPHFLYMKNSSWLYKHKLADGCSFATSSLSCRRRNILEVCSGLLLGAKINK